jgi:hypothetical protein
VVKHNLQVKMQMPIAVKYAARTAFNQAATAAVCHACRCLCATQVQPCVQLSSLLHLQQMSTGIQNSSISGSNKSSSIGSSSSSGHSNSSSGIRSAVVTAHAAGIQWHRALSTSSCSSSDFRQEHAATGNTSSDTQLADFPAGIAAASHSHTAPSAAVDSARNTPSSNSSSSSSRQRPHSSLDKKEAAKFAALADKWWDTTGGPFAPLHALNTARVAFLRSGLCGLRGLQQQQAQPLRGLKVLDVGCGGGLLSEPVARLGAQVHGIDVSDEGVAAAAAHAAGDPLLQERIRWVRAV